MFVFVVVLQMAGQYIGIGLTLSPVALIISCLMTASLQLAVVVAGLQKTVFLKPNLMDFVGFCFLGLKPGFV